jgi:hypothetical protein
MVGFLAEDGTRLISAVALVKLAGDLEFDKSRKFCTHGTVRQLLNRYEVLGVEIDLLSLEDEDKVKSFINILLGPHQKEKAQQVVDSLMYAKEFIIDEDEE